MVQALGFFSIRSIATAYASATPTVGSRQHGKSRLPQTGSIPWLFRANGRRSTRRLLSVSALRSPALLRSALESLAGGPPRWLDAGTVLAEPTPRQRRRKPYHSPRLPLIRKPCDPQQKTGRPKSATGNTGPARITRYDRPRERCELRHPAERQTAFAAFNKTADVLGPPRRHVISRQTARDEMASAPRIARIRIQGFLEVSRSQSNELFFRLSGRGQQPQIRR